ncbi:DnaD domain protein [Brevibacillus choshinensis]|uniref:DnaD domain protein n=1 Tax=Brevibacillus choshinensis TaxID=54911 RepID=A0ABX7FJU7_BRECH|nr:phage replisome organizer N-terminal domain-containing protein [Brevibacillus choshinensis]QRG65275.1 DnaD domain protein [Brevibacillus choshinensis]
MMPWFRLYPEILKDPKIRRFTTVQKWLWITAMCEAAQASERGKLFIADGIEYADQDLAQAAGLPYSELEYVSGFIDMCVTLKMMERHADGGVTLLNFNSRQYEKPSDSAEKTRERKRKQREKEAANKKGKPFESAGTSTFSSDEHKGHDNVTSLSHEVTPIHALDTDSDTDSDAESNSYSEADDKEPLLPLPFTRKEHKPDVVVVGGRDLYVFKSVIDQYKHYFVRDLNETIKNLLHSYLEDEVQMDMLAWAMRDSAEKGKDWNYAKGTINNLFSRGIKTAEQADLADQEFKKKQQEKPSGKIVQLVDKLPASVERQRELESSGQPAEKGKLITDDPELAAMLHGLRAKRVGN